MPGIAVAPDTRPAMHAALVEAVRNGGGEVVPLDGADALIWADPTAAAAYPDLISRGPGVRWIQLPYAGIDPFAGHLDHDHVWTCGKGVYAEECAEWIMAALLSAFRDIPTFARASSWPEQSGRNLLGANLTILGAGGIAESFLRLIEPWNCDITVVRRNVEAMIGAARTVGTDRLHEAVSTADAVIVCLSLTPETVGIIDATALSAMPDHAWLINVARGAHVVTNDLIAALDARSIAGAVLDVTDPEPLPDDNPLWGYDNVLITPHVGNTLEMGLPRLVERVTANVSRWLADEDLLGVVDVDAGY